MALDPVCGMEVEEEQAAARAEYHGETYYFCSDWCRQEFEKDPGEFLKKTVDRD